MNGFKVDVDKFISVAVDKYSGLSVYKTIMDTVLYTDVSKDLKFQRMFTYYYRIRRPKSWLVRYFNLFESFKSENRIGIRAILSALADGSDSVELSFASKMLATIDSKMPIWDRYVRINLGLPEVPPPHTPNRGEKAAELYDALATYMVEMLASEGVRRSLTRFDALFPQYASISETKKLDTLLWGTR